MRKNILRVGGIVLCAAGLAWGQVQEPPAAEGQEELLIEEPAEAVEQVEEAVAPEAPAEVEAQAPAESEPEAVEPVLEEEESLDWQIEREQERQEREAVWGEGQTERARDLMETEEPAEEEEPSGEAEPAE